MAADMTASVSPRVTVLMPVYNGAPFLTEAIQSILIQSFTDFEFLIIDDGSTDDSVAIIEAFKDSRIRLVNNGRNLGLVASLNRGLDLASGDYIARMDQDDISTPERLTRLVSFMDANPSVGVCGSWVRFFPKKHDRIWKLPDNHEDIKCWQFHTVGVAHPSVIIRKKAFSEQGLRYDPDFNHVEDFELWGRAINQMQFSNLKEVLLNYRVSDTQICAVYGKEQKELAATIRLKRLEDIGIHPVNDEHQLHENILNGELAADERNLDRAEQWLLRINEANIKNKVYSESCFSRRLQQVWFSICVHFAEASSCSLWRCLRSPLWSTVQPSAWHRLRALGAWVTRRGVWKNIREVRHG